MNRGDDRPHVVVVSSTYPRWAGDHEPRFVHDLARQLLPRFRVTVLTSRSPGASPDEMLDGIRVLRYAYAPRRLETLIYGGGLVPNLRRSPWKFLLLPGFIALAAWHLRRLLARGGTDVVHAHWIIPSGMVAAMVCRRVPFVVTAHGSDVFGLRGRGMDRLRRWVVSRAARTTTVSPPLAERLGAMGADTRRLTVLPMGTDLDRFRPDHDVIRDRMHVLFVGRLVPIKGCDVLLRAVALLAQRFPDVRLSIVGTGSAHHELVALASRLGLASRVDFLGSLDHERLATLYRRAGVLAWPSIQLPTGQQEGLGMVVPEALACGCPVIAADQPAMRWLLADAPEVMFRQGDDADLARALASRLDGATDFSAIDATLATRVRELLDWRVVGARYAQVLMQAAEGSVPYAE